MRKREYAIHRCTCIEAIIKLKYGKNANAVSCSPYKNRTFVQHFFQNSKANNLEYFLKKKFYLFISYSIYRISNNVDISTRRVKYPIDVIYYKYTIFYFQVSRSDVFREVTSSLSVNDEVKDKMLPFIQHFVIDKYTS